jgi:uncharacterized protein YbcI
MLTPKKNSMVTMQPNMAEQVAEAARNFQLQRTGHAPEAVTVVLSEDTLVVTLHGALSPAEIDLAKTPQGAAQVQEFHRQLFNDSIDSLRQEIKRITGVEVREAAAELEAKSGTVVHAFTTGTMVQVFLLAHSFPAESWSENGQVKSPLKWS